MKDSWKPNRRIKISYIIGSLRIGGAEKQIVELATRLPREQFEPQILCLTQGGPLSQTVEEQGVKVEVFNFYLIRGKYHPLSYLNLLISFWRMFRYLAREKPDIVHSYLYTAYVVGIICAWLTGVPVRIASRRSLGYFKEGKPWKQILENWVNKITDCVLVNSRAVREDVLKREKVDPGKIQLIYNGVDVEQFKRPIANDTAYRRELGIGTNSPVVGVVANLIHYKGYKELIEAAAIIKQQYPEVKFVFVGRDDGMQSQLETQAQVSGVADNIIFAGSRSDVPQLIQMFDLLALASYEEGFSNVILEGMAAGKPVVATNVGGNAEAIIDGVTGLIVPPRDHRALAQAMLKILSEPQLGKQMGQEAQNRAKQYFSTELLLTNMQSLYLELLKRKIVTRA